MCNPRASWCVSVLSGLLAANCCRAEHFAIDLEVKSSKETKIAHAEVADLAAKPKPRLVLAGEVGKPVRVHWTIMSTAKTGETKNVTVHFFAVRQAQVGQAAIPKLDKDVAAESALVMDFQPKDKARGEIEFQIDKPGAYLVRLETMGAANETDNHEHFAALDLLIK
ncbi:MAG TPA: hypothetical protein VK395_09805 [Gemmataceae bacterium]|nr:hypothetical protein [Gemmataceae bacterium]